MILILMAMLFGIGIFVAKVILMILEHTLRFIFQVLEEHHRRNS